MRKSTFVALLVLASAGIIHAQVRSAKTTDETSLRAFLPKWEQAQTRFINGDASAWKQHSSQRDDATILGAFGGYGEKGWATVGARYDWASSQYKAGAATMKVEYISVVASDGMGFTVAVERQDGARVGDKQEPERRALRVTQIFRLEDGAWKLLHRHADPLIEKKAPPGGK
jgi:ketosteroid isomerase-like protein